MVPFRILGRILCELTGSCRILENPVGSCIGFLPGNTKATLLEGLVPHFQIKLNWKCGLVCERIINDMGSLQSKVEINNWNNLDFKEILLLFAPSFDQKSFNSICS